MTTPPDPGRLATGGTASDFVARARDLYEAGLFQDALDAASKALSLEPGSADAAAVKAVAQARLRATAEAGDRQARIAGHVARARAHVNAGEWSKASHEAQAILDLHPENDEAYRLLQEIRTRAERAAVLERERLKTAKPQEPAPAPPKPSAPPVPPPAGGPTSPVSRAPSASARRPLPGPPAPTARKTPLRSSFVLYGGIVLLAIAVAAGAYFLYPSGRGEPVEAPAPGVAAGEPGAAPAGTPPLDAAVAPASADAAAQVSQAAGTPGPASPPPQPGAATKPARSPRTAPAARRRPDPALEAKTRARDLQQRYTRARAAAGNGDYRTAIAGFQAVLDLDPNYLDAEQQLEASRAGARNAAQQAVETGAKAEAAGDHSAAINRYLFALQLDPASPAAGDAVRRVRARMQLEGEDSFKRGRQYDALGRVDEAIGMYEKALKLLPPEHPNVKAAKERLAAIRGGD